MGKIVNKLIEGVVKKVVKKKFGYDIDISLDALSIEEVKDSNMTSIKLAAAVMIKTSDLKSLIDNVI